jgi:hypothetical protein
MQDRMLVYSKLIYNPNQKSAGLDNKCGPGAGGNAGLAFCVMRGTKYQAAKKA